MSQHNIQRLQELLALKGRRLHELEKQQAVEGISTPPHINIEIEDIRRDIAVMSDISLADVNLVKEDNKRPFKFKSEDKPLLNIFALFFLLTSIVLGISVSQLLSMANEKEAQISLMYTEQTIQAAKIAELEADVAISPPCKPSLQRFGQATVIVTNYSSKTIEYYWIDPSGKEALPIILHTSETSAGNGQINDSICIRELDSRKVLKNLIVTSPKTNVQITGETDLKVEITANN